MRVGLTGMAGVGILNLLLTLGFAFSGTDGLLRAEEGPVALWPEIEPYETGYLRVSDIHELYYELCGNPGGTPVFMLHGGPGGGSSPTMRRFCNPEKFLIVVYDQRGAGKSRPYADIRENTTWDLVSDIDKLREHLGLQKIILFGGSWGATLALAYAEAHSGNVSGLVLRGVFTATSEEIDHFYHGGVRSFFPEVYDRFVSSFPDPRRRPLPAYLLELLRSEDPAVREKFARVWFEYEAKIASLAISDEEVTAELHGYDPFAFSLIENYYMANGCFLEEGQLLRDAGKLRGIETVIVNGRYDMICPPETAYRLHKMLPGSKLIIAEGAGHWMGEPGIEKALVLAMHEFEQAAAPHPGPPRKARE
jgi:proline iminopeptidase